MKIFKLKTLQLLFIITTILSILFVSCQKDKIEQLTQQENLRKFNNKEANLYEWQKTVQLVKESTNRSLDFRKEEDLKLIYSAAMHTDSIFYISYQPSNFERRKIKWFEADISENDWTDVKREITDIYLGGFLGSDDCGTINPDWGDGNKISFQPNDKMPILSFHTSSFDFLQKLVSLDGKIQFIESNRSELLSKTSSYDVSDIIGCSQCNDEDFTPLNTGYTSDFELISWHQEKNYIDENTWNLSSGEGIGVAILDTGIDLDELYLSNQTYFASGDITNRTVVNKNFLKSYLQTTTCINGYPIPVWIENSYNPTNVQDNCGHGTKVAAMIAAPRGIDDELIFGTAYGCNLFNYRVVDDVLINKYDEKMAVIDALMEIKDDPRIHIVSMSIGTPFDDPLISNAIDAVYANGKIINCAAGTGPNFIDEIIYPAAYSTTNAITGIKVPSSFSMTPINQIAQPEPFDAWPDAEPCGSCFFHSLVDFSPIIQEGSHYPMVGLTDCSDNAFQQSYFSGSSVATAYFSAITAIAWAKAPHLIGPNIVGHLESYSSNSGNDEHLYFGHGYINVHGAVNSL